MFHRAIILAALATLMLAASGAAQQLFSRGLVSLSPADNRQVIQTADLTA